MIKTSAIFLAIALWTGTALAQGFEAGIIDQLRRDGYDDITMNTTFLGRVRLVALGEKGQREIVLNPRTGEILRDLWQVAPHDKGGSGAPHKGPPPQGKDGDDRGRNGRGDDRPADDRGKADRDGNSGSNDGGQGRGRGGGGDND